jgi:putative MATE family efflux protein
MQDFTVGSVTHHLLRTVGVMLVMMVAQTLYFLIDLYWVGRLGTTAVAAVSVAGNVSFLAVALSQVLGVGTTALVAPAVGCRDRAAARHAFVSALSLAVLVSALFLTLGLVLHRRYAMAMSADPATARLAAEYLRWFVPALALQLPMGVLGAALRATGRFRPGLWVSTASVGLNLLLAPVAMFGWGTGRPLGVAGAAVASLVAVGLGLACLTVYFLPAGAYLRLDVAAWHPRRVTARLAMWRRLLAVGLPAGVELALMVLFQVVVYTVARPFGASAQAGFGIGLRVLQAAFLPVVAIGLAVAPVAGQNVGAGRADRVRAVFRRGALLATGLTAVFTVLSLQEPEALVAPFTQDAASAAAGADYLRVAAWAHVATGLLYVTASLFQALGTTWPSLAASAVRMALVVGATLALTRVPRFALSWVWAVAVVAVHVQLVVALVLLRRAFRRQFGDPAEARAVAYDRRSAPSGAYGREPDSARTAA